MKIYFAGSIRGGRDDQAVYFEIIKLLSNYGKVLTEHIADKNLGQAGENLTDQEIYHRDLAWLSRSDCLVAEVSTPSLGVGFELGKMTEWGKPVLCLYRPRNGRLLSAMIAGCDKIRTCEYQDPLQLEEVFDDFFGRQ